MDNIHTKEILQVNKFYYPQMGGIEQVVRTISEGISDGYDCKVIASRPRGLGYSGSYNGIRFMKSSSFGVLQSVPISPTFPIRFRQAAENVDILHHHLPNPLSTVSHLCTPLSDIPTVVTYHSDIVRQSWALGVYEPIQRKFLNEVDLIITTSRDLLQQSELLSDFKHKCEIVPLSVDVDSVEQESEYNIEPDIEGPFILFVGRLVNYKGVEYLIDAMNEAEGTLLIVGDGHLKSDLEKRAKRRGVEESIYFLGKVSESKLGEYYKATDVFVLPSVAPNEAFGIVQLEAMARGVPVINTSLPTGVPWVSQDGITGKTVSPRDPKALAEAINSILNDDQLRQEYGKQARLRVEEKFSQKKMIQRIEEIYDRLDNI